jgi:large-conductance mechanosensitive channel
LGEEFDFHRILFRPRYGVQSRELTQLQTILQAQLQRLGTANFKNGSPVLGGEIALDTNVVSGKTLLTDNVSAFFDRTNNLGLKIYDVANTTTHATVRQYVAPDEGATPDAYLIFKYDSQQTFPTSGVVNSPDSTANATFGANADTFSGASVFSVEEGVFFVSGFFVRCKAQTIVVSEFDNRPDAIVGLNIIEEVIDELDDVVGSTLLDPANLGAPGAHRLRLRLELDTRGLSADVGPNFITLATIEQGVIRKGTVIRERFVKMSELNDILARRTFDESGDYVITQFRPVIGNTDVSNTSNFHLSLGPGKAYVRGWEVATTEPTDLLIRKGRDIASVNAEGLALQVGNYALVSRVAAYDPQKYFANTSTVDLHCVNASAINTASVAAYNYSRIGTAKVRLLETVDVPANNDQWANSSVYKMFFYDTAFDALTGNLVSATLTNGAVVCTAAIANGLPGVASAANGATVVLSGASSPVTGTFTVVNYAPNGANVELTLKEYLPALPNANTQYRLLYQPKDIDCFAGANNSYSGTYTTPYSSNLFFQADVTLLGGKDDAGQNTIITGPDPSLIYQFGPSFIVANSIAANTTWDTWVQLAPNTSITLTGANATVSLSITDPLLSFPTGSLSAETAQRYFVVFDTTNDAGGRGQIVQFGTSPNASHRCLTSITMTTAGSHTLQFTYHHGSANAATRSFHAVARATTHAYPIREKTLVLANSSVDLTGNTSSLDDGQIAYFNLNATAGFAYTLKVPDVHNVTIFYQSTNTAFADLTTATDVTSLFTLDNGQRDNTYEYARVICNRDASRTISPDGRLLILFDRFAHVGRGPATVDSFLGANSVAAGMTYDAIPSYTSPRTNRTVSLRDVLDFRPARTANTVGDGLYNAVTEQDGTDTLTTYLDGGTDSYYIPTSDGVWYGDFDYYLSRIDRIGIGYDGLFHIIEGKPALTPEPPTNDPDSLLIYQITIPPYTLVDANGVPTTTVLTTFDHKRYTMQDISKVENRVAHLEYYTALNSLERITKDQDIFDQDGNDRFKNGILVDSFHGADVGDVASEDFTASIDVQNRELRTGFRSFATLFTADTSNTGTSNGITVVGDMAIPTYTTEAFITQPFATHSVSVNPFDVAAFYGSLKLSPAVDTWKDTTSVPAQVIDLGGPTQAWVNATMPSFTNWGEWDQTWSGIVANQTQRAWFTPPGWTPQEHGLGAMTELSWQDITTQTNYERQGTTYEYQVTSTTASLGNRIVDTSIVHRVRERDIVFSGDGLKPKSSLYAFFDGVNVDNYVQRGNIIELASLLRSTAPTYRVGQTIYVEKPLRGTATVLAGNTTVTGVDTLFEYDLVVGQIVKFVLGASFVFLVVDSITSNTQFRTSTAGANTLSGASVRTYVPVTITEVSPRFDSANVVYTLKVARAQRDSSVDQVPPYPINAGSVSPVKLAGDTSNNSLGASVVVINELGLQPAVNITGATCFSGIVRGYNANSQLIRLDLDVTEAEVANNVTALRIVGGPGAGQSQTITTYWAGNNTALVSGTFPGLVVNQSIYSIGRLQSDGFVDNSNPAVAGRAGCASGVFHLQNGAFATGSRLFRLTDDASNRPTSATTSAESSYEASGLTVTQQATSVTSRSAFPQRVGPAQESFSVTDHSVQQIALGYVDPLAETFLVDAAAYPQGVFIASVDLCFAAKPDDDIPVVVELRNVVNGYPSSQDLVPCTSADGLARVTLRNDQVTVITSATPNIADPLTVTTFTFAAPVHLLPGKEYAIVVRSDSSDYRVYTAELGGNVLGTADTKVSSQPYAGSFFKSQNASAWTESPFEDLMFRLNRAKWTGTATTPQVAHLVAHAVPPTANAIVDSIEFYPHDVHFSDLTGASYTLGVKPMNTVTEDLTGQSALYYDVHPSEWRPLAARSLLQGYDEIELAENIIALAPVSAANTVELISALSTWSADVAPYIDLKKLNVLCLHHLTNDMGLQADDIMFTDPGVGYLPTLQDTTVNTVATSTTVELSNGVVDFTTLLAPGDYLVLRDNIAVTVASVNADGLRFYCTANVGATLTDAIWWTHGNSNVSLTFSGGEGTGAAGYATIGRDGRVSNVVLTADGSGYIGMPTVTAAPVANVASYTATQNTAVLTYLSELDTHGGNALTRYFTRPVTLADGFEARDIVVYFDANRPLGTKFYVYYKVLGADQETERFEDQPWRLMTQITDDSTFCTKWEQFKEFEFHTPDDRALNADDDTTDKFKTFAVKVVMATDNPVYTPRIANFRAIALDT